MSSPTPESDSQSSILVPAYPFNIVNGDVILRSSDGADFHVYKAILSLVSPVFQTMFTLPQSESSPIVPVITLQENSTILDRSLRFFYPGAQPTVATLEELRDVIEVLISKYDMQSIVPIAKQHFKKYISTHPVASYAVALTYEWKDVAAKESLKLPLRVPDKEASEELNHIPAAAYHNLLHYHYLCGGVAKGVTEILRWVPAPNDFIWFSCTSCAGHSLNWYLLDGLAYPARSWFIDYLKAVGELVMESPGADLRLHRTIYDALQNATKCSTCRGKIFNQFPQFISIHLTSKIKEAVDAVQLKL
ncbi:hypothetical protein C8R44DRAFT_658320 [Mycena epipterygia]|nr:hypothetical protein C8R44DRAFT_658320 [Mycena epipterygia]